MGSKRTSRRELLKGGAVAGGFTLGAVAGGALAGRFTSGAVAPALGQTPASGQAPAHGHRQPDHDYPMIPGSKELIAYGERSHFVTSVRIAHPMGGRPSPDAFGKVFHVASPLQDLVGVITPSSLHYVATTRGSFIPDIDPQAAHSDDSRPGGSAPDLHHGGLEAPPVSHPAAFHRVRGKPAQWATKDRAGIARDDQLRRMDRRAAFDAAQGVRPERQRDMVRR